MAKLFEKIFAIDGNEHLIRSRHYGVIEVVDARLMSIQLRPWPKVVSVGEAAWLGTWKHQNLKRDRCLVFFNQPMGHRNFLALKYAETSLGTRLATLRTGLRVLDEIARIKKSDAIMCEATNKRLTDRVMQHLGYERHLPNSRRRHFIRRFYGEYPETIVSLENESDLSPIETYSS